MRKISIEELKVMAKKTLNSKELKAIHGGGCGTGGAPGGEPPGGDTGWPWDMGFRISSRAPAEACPDN